MSARRAAGTAVVASHPSWCCQRCGAEVGWLGRAIDFVTGRRWHVCAPPVPASASKAPQPEPSPIAPDWPADAFEQFWSHYPREEGWLRAESILKRMRERGEPSWAVLIAGVEKLRAKSLHPKFIPFAATWLRERRWEPEMPGPVEIICSTAFATRLAETLVAGVMVGEVSLSTTRDAFAFLLLSEAGPIDGREFDAFAEARRAAIRMIEDRARRATAFREPRR